MSETPQADRLSTWLKTQQELATARGVTFSFIPMVNPDHTSSSEMVCAEILAAIDCVEAGETEVVDLTGY
jgi:hypothetical protein